MESDCQQRTDVVGGFCASGPSRSSVVEWALTARASRPPWTPWVQDPSGIYDSPASSVPSETNPEQLRMQPMLSSFSE